MIIKRTIALTALGIFAMATAQTPPAAATSGRGAVMSENNRRAEFDFEVIKRLVQGQPPAVRGRFEFTMAGEQEGQRIRIVMERPQALGVDGNVAEFGGTGYMMRPSPNGPVRVNGRVSVRVQDLWNPTPTGGDGDEHPRDRFAVRFFVPSPSSTTGQMVFDYAGQVRRGNLVVRSAPTNP